MSSEAAAANNLPVSENLRELNLCSSTLLLIIQD